MRFVVFECRRLVGMIQPESRVPGLCSFLPSFMDMTVPSMGTNVDGLLQTTQNSIVFTIFSRYLRSEAELYSFVQIPHLSYLLYSLHLYPSPLSETNH